MPKDIVVPIKADAPRQMSRDDRRIIFGKLETVWSDKAKTYDEGWTDERVSKDLGVPRAWVATVRDENFGPVVAVDVEALKAENDAFKGLLMLQYESAQAMEKQLRASLEAAEKITGSLAASVKNWKSQGHKAA